MSNWNQEAYKKLKAFEIFLKQKLIQSERLNADETSINIDKQKHWLHVNSNDQWTYITVHKKRGQDAMDSMDILPYYH
ncbi:IS66 family transposase [Candidatus Venteria ishoeyi]|uniref:IS66 family transposase n=1 Tax=Candidatus Venteria ishoeyi TaxID=1899563 RepID=UPI00387E545A